MGKASTAYVTCIVSGKTYTYHFTGVTGIAHNLALNLNNEASEGSDIVNGARNLANQVLVNMIPLVCSYGEVNDLLSPFCFLRGGKGLGSLLCLRGTDEPSTPDPVGNNLNEFQLLWGDSL